MLALTRGFIGLLLAALLVSSVSPQTSYSLRQRVPKPDPAKYRSIRDAKDWHNPKLVVRPEGVEIVGITPAGQTIPLDSVSERLELLADSAWPYGLIVMVTDAGIVSSSKEYPRIQANRSKLLKLLTAHGIEADLWPSA
jgi:hypothetical protein